MILSAARIVFCCCCKRLTYSLGFSKLCAMASSSLTARLAADAIELTRAAYKPSVCSWYPHCSMPATAWACGCVGKLGARSEQQAAEQQQRQLDRGWARAWAQIQTIQQQNSVRDRAQEAAARERREEQDRAEACLVACLLFDNHISHSCYIIKYRRCPFSAYFFLSIQTRGFVLSTCRFFNATWLQATISRRIGSAVCTALHQRVCISCIIYQYKKPISSNPSTVSAWRSVPITTGTIITRRLSVGTPNSASFSACVHRPSEPSRKPGVIIC